MNISNMKGLKRSSIIELSMNFPDRFSPGVFMGKSMAKKRYAKKNTVVFGDV